MEKRDKIGFLVFFTLLFLLAGYIFISTNLNRQKNLSYHFDGLVQKVDYDTKMVPTVTVDGKTYILSAGYNFNQKIERGDRLKKSNGSTIYILIKSNTWEVIKFNNYSY